MRSVTVTVHHEGVSWWAESDELPGFSALAASRAELREMVASGVDFYLEGEQHRLVELDDGPWSRYSDGALTRGLPPVQASLAVFRFKRGPLSSGVKTNPAAVRV